MQKGLFRCYYWTFFVYFPIYPYCFVKVAVDVRILTKTVFLSETVLPDVVAERLPIFTKPLTFAKAMHPAIAPASLISMGLPSIDALPLK